MATVTWLLKHICNPFASASPGEKAGNLNVWPTPWLTPIIKEAWETFSKELPIHLQVRLTILSPTLSTGLSGCACPRKYQLQWTVNIMTFPPNTTIKDDWATQRKYARSQHIVGRTARATQGKFQPVMLRRWESRMSVQKEASERLLVRRRGDFWGLQIHFLLPEWLSMELSVEVPRTVGPTTEQLKFLQPLADGPSTDRTEKGDWLHRTALPLSWSHPRRWEKLFLCYCDIRAQNVSCSHCNHLASNPSFSPHSFRELGHLLTVHDRR